MTPASNGPHWSSGGATHKGCFRRVNQDAFLDRPDVGLWAVADGMGGHTDGAAASRALVEGLDTLPRQRLLGSAAKAIRARLQEVNRQLVDAGQARGEVVIGSTVALLAAIGDHCALLWAGDSRIYRLRHGRLAQLTRDHTEVQQLLDVRLLTPEQAASHPRANVVLRAIGATPDLRIDTRVESLQPRDRYLICSDGLDKELADARIAELLGVGTSEQAAHSLVDAALDAGGHDNVTAAVITISEHCEALLDINPRRARRG